MIVIIRWFIKQFKMLSFGQVKNNLEQLKKYLSKMQFFNLVDKKITNKDLEEPNFRKAGNELFLPLINFILIEYSTQIYWKIIEMVPSIKVVDDKQFIQHCFSISRKMLSMDVQLTSDQFLSNKYFQKKLQFVSKLSKAVFERSQAIKKTKSKSVSNYMPISSEGLTHQNYTMEKESDDQSQQQEEVPRVINKIPARIQMDPFPKQQKFKDTVPIQKPKANGKFNVAGEVFEEYQVQNFINKNKNQPVKRPIQKPSTMHSSKQQYAFSSQSEQERDNNLRKMGRQSKNNKYKDTQIENKDQFNRFRLDGKKNQIKSYASQNQDEESIQYVTKEDFTQLMQLVMSTSQTINELSGKFCQFQAKIGADVSNLSARVLMLENNVRLLKDNL